MEMVGVDPLVIEVLERYMSARLCANTSGQVRETSALLSKLNILKMLLNW